jgi:hypothetical protein
VLAPPARVSFAEFRISLRCMTRSRGPPAVTSQEVPSPATQLQRSEQPRQVQPHRRTMLA